MIKNKRNKIKETINEAIMNLTDIIDVNTVVGSPITSGENTIIPIAKVTFCLLTGGGEYGKINVFQNGDDLPFSAGNGSVISIKPCGFLLKNKDEDYKILSVSNNNIDGLFDKTTEFIKNTLNNNINNENE